MRWQRPDLTSWTPFEQLTNLRDEINRLFDTPSSRDTEFFGWAPAVDVYEDHDNLIVRAELPGMKKEEIDVSLHEGSLIISGERKSESKDEKSETSRAERFYGRFQRALELPKPVDPTKVTATYKDGVLTVKLPKTEESKPRQITVKAN
jgi:HSP20 family protein